MGSASGTIEFEGRSILGLSPDRIVKLGISVVPEGRQLFGDLTVRDNLILGAYTRKNAGEIRQHMERVLTYFPVLKERINVWSHLLSGGEQQMLVIGRALMARPKLLILDEPSLGLAPILVQEMFAMIKNLSESEGIAVLLAEQNANQAVSIASHGYVLEVGKVVLDDTAENLMGNDMVRRAYLGF
jgi:branched-chain amino acid transport system ATP-binding protein